jgi:hypothetical protein
MELGSDIGLQYSYQMKSECFVCAFVLPTTGICIGPQSHWHVFLDFSMVQTGLELRASCIVSRR